MHNMSIGTSADEVSNTITGVDHGCSHSCPHQYDQYSVLKVELWWEGEGSCVLALLSSSVQLVLSAQSQGLVAA